MLDLHNKRKRSVIRHIFVSVRVFFEFTIFIECRVDFDLYKDEDGEKILNKAICLVLSDKF